MDLRSVRCFLRVAETLHFGRAATDLHLSQPALSQRIRTLERDVGAVLLERNRRGVRLTEAGIAFRNPAKAIVAQSDRAIDLARRAELGLHGRLSLGFTVIASYTALPQAVQTYRAANPGVTIDLIEMNSPAVEEALELGVIDLGVLHPPLERHALHIRMLPEEQLVLAVPDGHPLAAAPRRLTFDDLAEHPLITAPRGVGPVLFDNLVACFRNAGREPSITQEATPMTTLAGLVASGAGVGFVTSGIARAGRPGLTFREVLGAPAVPMAVAWSPPEPHGAAKRFLDVLAATDW